MGFYLLQHGQIQQIKELPVITVQELMLCGGRALESNAGLIFNCKHYRWLRHRKLRWLMNSSDDFPLKPA
jgi:hypothetical protein